MPQTSPLFDRQHLPSLPRLLLRGLFQAPFSLQRLVLEQTLQRVFKEALRDGDLDFLKGQHLKIHIIDMDCIWYFSHLWGRIVVSRKAHESVAISGHLKEFVQLATRCVDPDTLFFQRRLVIEGSTEMGLQIKNLLDSLDIEELPLPLRKGIEIASRFVR
ncbi:MAG: SCP2 domain-containing protein [Gammaproteobacteria bacterium]|nr:MAG: SCP2 domain-containing protein [Gammaproteobacteria bacterium]